MPATNKRTRRIFKAAITRRVSRDGVFQFEHKSYQALGLTHPKPKRYEVVRRSTNVVALHFAGVHVADAVEVERLAANSAAQQLAELQERYRWRSVAAGELPEISQVDTDVAGHEWATSKDLEIVVHGQLRVGWLVDHASASPVLQAIHGPDAQFWDRDTETLVPATHWRYIGPLPEAEPAEVATSAAA